jgi:hypothetical protein
MVRWREGAEENHPNLGLRTVRFGVAEHLFTNCRK